MEKHTIDDLTFIKIFNTEDLKDNDNLERLSKQCKQIIKTYEGELNVDSEINNFDNNLSDLYFKKDLESLLFVVYSKKDCEPGKGKPISFAYLTAKENDWSLDLIFKKQNSENFYSDSLIKAAFDYLKSNTEKVSAMIPNTNKRCLKFFEKLLRNNTVKGESVKIDKLLNVEIKNKEDLTKLTLDLAKSGLMDKSIQNMTIFNFDLKAYVPTVIKNNLGLAL